MMDYYPLPRTSTINRNWAIIILFMLTAGLLYLLTLTNNAGAPSHTTAAGRQELSKQKALKSYGKLPIYFIPNKGQLDPKVKFYASGAGFNLYLTKDGVTYSFARSKSATKPTAAPGANRDLAKLQPTEGYALKVSFLGVNPGTTLDGREEQEGKVNYLIGNDPNKWQTNISTYSRVTYKNLYDGINLIYKGDHKKIKYEFIVKPGADYRRIKLAYSGADSLKLDGKGNLLINTPWASLKDKRPFVYQVSDGKQVRVQADFTIENNVVRFVLTGYDTRLPLVIDPGLIYSSFLGGSSAEPFDRTSAWPSSLTLDSSGNAYVTGGTLSSDFPITAGAYDASFNGWSDVFVTKLNSSGSSLVYSTFLGGSGDDYGYDVTLDSSGNVYLTGSTYSSNFPTTDGAYDTSFNGIRDVFVTKLDSSGSNLVYSTFLGGGGGDEWGFSLTLDSSGNAYVTGDTSSSDFPITAGAYDASYNGAGDVFATKLNSSGSSLIYSTFLGGSGDEWSRDITLDSSGNAYVTGGTSSSDFPITAGAYDASFNGWSDVFVTKLNSSGSSLVYSTFLGGSGGEWGSDITLDSSGNTYVTGGTTAYSNFPTTAAAYDTSFNGGYTDVFVTKLDSSGSSLIYSTFLGGSYEEWSSSLSLDSSGNVYLTGYTYSSNFPTTAGAYDTSFNGVADSTTDVFVTKLDSSGSSLIYSTFLGGSGDEVGSDITLDSSGNVYLTGGTYSSNFPTTAGAYDASYNGTRDVFVAKLDMVPLSDIIPPITTLSTSPISPDGTNGWFKTTPSITLTRNEPGATYYSWTSSAGPWTTYSAPFNAPEGENTLYYYSVDTASNAEAVKSQLFKVDTGVPSSTITSPMNGALINDVVYTVTGTASDPASSGVAKVEISVNDGPWQLATGTTSWSYSWPLPPDGSYNIKSRATDNAGNQEAPGLGINVTVDNLWTQVNADGFGDVNNKSATSFIVFNGYIYNGGFNNVTGGKMHRSSDGTTWNQVNADGFGDSNNMEVWPSSVFNGYLYAGAWNEATGAEIWRTADGTNWEQVNVDGFGDANNIGAGAYYELNGYLYAGTWNNVTGGEIWRTADGTNWEQVNVDGFGDINNKAAKLLAPVFNGYLYAGTDNSVTGTEIWRTSDGLNWEQVNTDGFGSSNNRGVPDLQMIFNGYLYTGTGYNPNGGEIWRTADGTNWEQVTSNGFGDVQNNVIKVDGIYNGYLYAGTRNTNTGTEIWRTADGTNWNQVNVDGFGDINNFVTKGLFVNFNGSLYVGTRNNITGGEIWARSPDTTPPTTILSTTPVTPDGDNGWFKTTPSITLTRNEPGATYYSWTSSTGPWTTYSAPFNAPEGQNTLYYYSVDTAGNAEAVKSQLFKVDTQLPASFLLNLPADGATVNRPYPYFSWNASSDTNSGLAEYQLYIDGSLSRDNIINWTAAVPPTALANGSHNWFVRAWDDAGNYTDSATRNFTISVGSEKITFFSNRDGNNEIYVMNADGSNQTRLTNNNADDSVPAFSPDGSKIVFFSARDGNGEIYIMNADGSDQTNLTNSPGDDWRPAFSPDGKIAFHSNRDGDPNQIYVMNADGTNPTRLTNDPRGVSQRPVFSPDGSKIVFWSGREGNQEIYIMNADGSNQTRLTNNPGDDEGPFFSRDGSKILWHTDRDGNYEIYEMNLDGSNPTNLTNNPAHEERPAQSINGDKIAFDSNRDGNMEIYAMNADGTGQTNLTNNAAWDDAPDWGPGSVPAPADITPPVTSLSSNPSSSDGTNGWFKTTPSITLTRNEPGTTYYKWEFEPSWTTYVGSFTAPQGQHTLYYYSRDTVGNAELVRSAAFKVDSQPPSTPTNVSAIPMSLSQIDLSWDASTDTTSGIAGYKIYNADTNAEIATTTSTSYSFTSLNPATTYRYYLKTYDAAGNLSAASNTVSATTYQAPVPTSTGTNVSVDLGNSVSMNFEQVTGSGTTSVMVSYTAPAPPPGGFSFLGYYWDLSTTATFTGTIRVTFPYDPAQITGAEENLRLFHWENGLWQDVTVLPVDTVNNLITGEVTSLSPFALGMPSSPPPPTGLNTYWLLIAAISLMIGGWQLLSRAKKRFV